MSSSKTILVELDNFDRKEYDDDLKNDTYIGPKSNNTVLHIIAMVKERFDEFKERITYLLINKIVDINKVNYRGRNCIHIALKYSNFKFVKFVVNNFDINLNLPDDNDITCFDFACDRNNYEIASLILSRIYSYKTKYIDNITNPIEREALLDQIYKKLQSIDNIFPNEDPVFKIYNRDDFEFYPGKKGEGSYGFVRIVKEKSTGKELIVKKFDIDRQHLYLPTSIIRDVVFLRKLNKYGSTSKVYGVMNDKNGDFYMVMENLDLILSERIKTIYKLKPEKRKEQLFNLIKNVMECIDVNSSLGIIHCDTKENNVMTDKEGVVRFIDYGFSYYLGISPYIENINRVIHIGSYLADDGTRTTNTLCDFRDENDTNKVLFSVDKGYVGLNTDIPSVAFMILSQTIGKKNDLYGSHNGKIYTNIRHIIRSDDYIVSTFDSKRIHDRMINTFGHELTELLISMMSIDSRERYNAKTLINDIFLKNPPLRIPDSIPLTPFTYKETDKVGEKIILQMAERYNTEASNQYIRSGFVYYDSIYDNWKDETIILERTDQASGNVFARCLSLASKHKISMDAYYNAVYYMYNLMNKTSEDNKIQIRYDLLIYLIMSYSKIYEENDFDYVDVIREIAKDKKITNDVSNELVLGLFKTLRTDPNFFQMKPTMVFVNYIKFILQSTCKDPLILSDIMSRFQIELYKEITRQDGQTIEIKISDLVKNVYNKLPGKVEINIPF